MPPGLLRTTKLPGEGNPTGDGEDLLFDLDEGHHLRSEAESLRTMLDAVRFTLVRRLGTGGMGVVYEAYDQKRGELVALKTMRRVDPLGPGPLQAGVPLARRHHPPQPGQPLRAVRGRRSLVLHHGAGRGDRLRELCPVATEAMPAAAQGTAAARRRIAADRDRTEEARERRRPIRPAVACRHLPSMRPGSAMRCASSPRGSRPCTSRGSCTGTSSRRTSW